MNGEFLSLESAAKLIKVATEPSKREKELEEKLMQIKYRLQQYKAKPYNEYDSDNLIMDLDYILNALEENNESKSRSIFKTTK